MVQAKSFSYIIVFVLSFPFFLSGDAQAKMGKVSNTKGSFQKKLAEMKKKIKQTNQDANACDTGKYCTWNLRRICSLSFSPKLRAKHTRGIRARGILRGRGAPFSPF